MIKIEANSLHRLCYNALLFDTKSAKAFSAYGETLKMNTSDGQVYLEDVGDLTEKSENIYQWIMSAEATKVLEVALRKIEGLLSLVFGQYTLSVVSQGEVTIVDISRDEYAQQSALFDEWDGGYDDERATFSINADRLRKLSLVQPKDYPVEMRIRMVDGIDTDVLLFTKGPTVRGAYATLKRD